MGRLASLDDPVTPDMADSHRLGYSLVDSFLPLEQCLANSKAPAISSVTTVTPGF